MSKVVGPNMVCLEFTIGVKNKLLVLK